MFTIFITFVDLSIVFMEYIKHITQHQIDRFEHIKSTFSTENRSCCDDNMSCHTNVCHVVSLSSRTVVIDVENKRKMATDANSSHSTPHY